MLAILSYILRYTLPRDSTISSVVIILVLATLVYVSSADLLVDSVFLSSTGFITTTSPKTIVINVSQGMDDGFRMVWRGDDYLIDRSGVCYDTGKDFWSGKQVIADSWWLFRDVNIPQGAIILNARLTFTASATQLGGVCNTKISAEDTDDATSIAGDYKEGWDDYENRPKTMAAVPWHNLPGWWEEERHTSPDISAVLQEIIARSGWASGNSLQIFWMDDGSSEGAEEALRSACGYEYPLAPGSGDYAAELEVTYEANLG